MAQSIEQKMTKIDGIKAKHVVIQPSCRTRGDDVAIEDALNRIREEFKNVASYKANDNANFHIVLTVDRQIELGNIR